MNTKDTNALHPLAIGGVTLENTIILAPMAGVSDLPFRLLSAEMGAGLVCMEMVSANAIHYRNKKTDELLKIDAREKPVSLQLFGSDPRIMAEAAKTVLEKTKENPPDILDINMGCPVPKVVKNGEGSALMKNPRLAGEIMKAVVGAVGDVVPVTVKIRKGFDEEHLNAVEMAKIAEDVGISAIAVHGRTREQYYAGRADWTCIADVKNAVQIPVFGNGDLRTAEDVIKMAKQTGCDGFMIARGAEGNPWIFREIIETLKTGRTPPRPTADEIADMIMRQAELMVECKGENIAIREMRKHAAWYTAGLKHASKFRGQLATVSTMEELRVATDKIRGISGENPVRIS